MIKYIPVMNIVEDIFNVAQLANIDGTLHIWHYMHATANFTHYNWNNHMVTALNTVGKTLLIMCCILRTTHWTMNNNYEMLNVYCTL